MSTLQVILNVAILLVFVGILYVMNKKHVKFSNRVFAGLGLGIALGLGLQLFYGIDSQVLAETTPWYSIIGSGYVKLLQMVAMPLIFISILIAFTKMTIGKNFGKMAALILAILIGTTAVSAGVGILSATIFDLDATQIMHGDAETERGAYLEEKNKWHDSTRFTNTNY